MERTKKSEDMNIVVLNEDFYFEWERF